MEKELERNEDIKMNGEKKFMKNMDVQLDDKSIYEDIFKEMLTLENARSFRNRQKYCLIKIVITNLDETVKKLELGDKNILLFKFANFLFKNLRKKDIYLLSETGSFLVLFPDISIETAGLAMKRVQDEAKIEYRSFLDLSWKVVIGTDKEEDIKPIIKKAHLFSDKDTRIMSKRSTGRSGEKNISEITPLRSLFKGFLFSFIIFSFAFITIQLVIFYFFSSSTIIPDSFNPGVLISNYFPGLAAIFGSLNMEITPFLFLIFQALIFCFIFGFGIVVGFIINLKERSGSNIRHRPARALKR
jgi:hypothetical protein